MTIRGPGQTLFQFVRHWSRRHSTSDDSGDQGRLVMTCEAVHSLNLRGTSATVKAAAHEIGIDQSGASRMIKNAAAAGYLTMSTSPADGRRREAVLTAEGRSMLDEAHRWQEEIFHELTTDWSDEKRSDFHQAMTDLMERSPTLTD